MENEQQVISHEQALAALNSIELQYADVPNQKLVESYIKQQQLAGHLPPRATLARALEQLLNSYSAENGSNTPDFILASLLMQTLKTWELHTVERDRWWGNRSLLGVGGGGAAERTIDGAVPTSEKTLLPGVDITKPRDLIGEALGAAAGMSNYRFEARDPGAL